MTNGRQLDELGFGLDPMAAPLSYPGRPPGDPATLLLDDSLLRIRPAADPVGRWTMVDGEGSLDELLTRCGAAGTSDRHPVLAVGSNASPAQLHRKCTGAGLRPVVPVTAVTVRGVVAGVSAHVNRWGYLPATPVIEAESVSELFLIWLDEEQLAAMDRTEPNYRRMPVPAAHQVALPGDRLVPGCWFYVSRHGCLLGAAGEPRRLTDQRTLIAGLLDDVPELTGLVGPSIESWLVRTRDERLRDEVRGVLLRQGMVGRQEGLGAVAATTSTRVTP